MFTMCYWTQLTSSRSLFGLSLHVSSFFPWCTCHMLFWNFVIYDGVFALPRVVGFVGCFPSQTCLLNLCFARHPLAQRRMNRTQRTNLVKLVLATPLKTKLCMIFLRVVSFDFLLAGLAKPSNTKATEAKPVPNLCSSAMWHNEYSSCQTISWTVVALFIRI